ncbi:MAG: hypothetical protein BroJett030_02220 [Alphaproteobacteria bacterium]|nr:MAG: hypothetical protein BroJett030_02220 [Alphaproteobacteria bacterium]
MVRRGLRLVLALAAGLFAVVAVYLGATIVGAAVPADPPAPPRPAPPASGGQTETVYLLTTLLHADFALAVDGPTRARFAFLAEAGVPIDHPALKFLVFGWGSRAFYTQTPRLADIRPGPTLTAITGDESVLRVAPAGDVRALPNAVAIALPPGGLARLADFIEASFARDGGDGVRLVRPGFGLGDAFFAARGAFNILRPCNVWAAEGLRAAGLPTGLWTPTTQSLKLGLWLHAPEAIGQ